MRCALCVAPILAAFSTVSRNSLAAFGSSVPQPAAPLVSKAEARRCTELEPPASPYVINGLVWAARFGLGCIQTHGSGKAAFVRNT